ncbi:hypothetical protein CMI47_04065 [Candidatus Pacearchaeota archaeon]|nr:hypothetical protein [Candidatus Pacearchaeota archaeon]
MARRKNTRFIDPRWFMDEKMETIKEEIEEGMGPQGQGDPPWAPEWRTSAPGHEDVVSTEDLFKLMSAGYGPDDLRGLNYGNLTPEMASILGRGPMAENVGGGVDMAKAEELAATFQKSPTIMAAVEQAMQDPEVQKALEQATAGGLQEEEDPYADDPVGAAYQKKAQLAGAGEVASAGVAAVGAGAVVGPAILTTIAGKMVVTGAIAALGIAGGAALMGLAIVAAAAFNKRRHDSSQKAKGYTDRDVRDFSPDEWRKIHSGD